MAFYVVSTAGYNDYEETNNSTPSRLVIRNGLDTTPFVLLLQKCMLNELEKAALLQI